MAKNRLKPTPNQTFRIVREEGAKGTSAIDFSAELARSRKAEEQGEWERACEIRFAAMQALVELLPEDEVVELDWDDKPTQDAIVVAYCSAVDLFLVSDWEMAAAGLEMVLDVDSDDHLGATTLLAFAYGALGEWESLEGILDDLSEKSPERALLALWCEYGTSGRLGAKNLAALARYHSAYLEEWLADEHPADGAYLADIDSERPSKRALARELWLQTEHLWTLQGDFMTALRRAQTK